MVSSLPRLVLQAKIWAIANPWACSKKSVQAEQLVSMFARSIAFGVCAVDASSVAMPATAMNIAVAHGDEYRRQ